jgi:uncharacterized phiE125 gp8 family phage protein
MSLQITTDAVAEPVTLAEVKARLNLTSTADDAKITQQITVARQFAEKVTRRSLAYKTYTLFLKRFPYPTAPLHLPAPPLVTVNSINYLDDTWTSQLWPGPGAQAPLVPEYAVAPMQSPGLIYPAQNFIYPCTARVPGAVQVSFSSGYNVAGAPTGTPPIPGPVAEAIRQLTIHMYEHPEAVTAESMKELPLALREFLRNFAFHYDERSVELWG